MVLCPCVTNPKKKTDHIIIPERRLCFTTENAAHRITAEKEKTASSKRFTNATEIKKHAARLNFNKRAAAELLDEAVNSLANAKAVHDDLEKYYVSAMDFDFVHQKADRLISEIFE